MNHQDPVGLQWKLAAILLATSLLSSGLVAAGYVAGTAVGLSPLTALFVGVLLGLSIGLVVSILGIWMVRSIKLRLWEAGDMAGRIARGDFRARVMVGAPDEVGWLEAQLNEMGSQLEEAVAGLKRLAEQNRLLAEEAGRGAALEERARLARDLHDTVNQQLFVLAMRTAAARKRLERMGGEAGALVDEMLALEELARRTHSETRGLILQLRPATLESQGLVAALAEYLKTTGGREGWETTFEADAALSLSGATSSDLFRVAQEALHNVSKHAAATKVCVTLRRTEEGVCLQIQDNGKGFDMKSGIRPTAVGLLGMRERLAVRGGTIRVQSQPNEGTRVIALLPATEGGEEA